MNLNEGQVDTEQSTPIENEVIENAQEQQEQPKMSAMERIAARFDKSFETPETSNSEKIESGVKTDADDTNAGNNVSKYQLIVDSVYTIGDGEDAQEMTGAEIRDGLLRQKDYTQKTQALAEQRKKVEEQEQEFAKNTAFYDQANQAALSEYNNVDWQLMQQRNPALYQQEAQKYQRLIQRQEEINRIKKDFNEQVNVRMNKQLEAKRAKFNEDIKAYIPDWNEKSRESFSGLEEHYGISLDEINSAIDPRFFAMAKDALSYRNAGKNLEKTIEETPQKQLPERGADGKFKASGKRKSPLERIAARFE